MSGVDQENCFLESVLFRCNIEKNFGGQILDHSVDYYTYLGESPTKEIRGTNANCMVLPPYRDWHYALL